MSELVKCVERAPSAAPKFLSSQLFGVVAGGVISASVSIIGILIVSRQQRDEAEYPSSFSWEEITKDRETVKAKVEELTIAMQRQLRELET